MNRIDILVAGIGNIFLGDDAFGVEVVRRLAARPRPANIQIRDFGIRGFDLAYALDSAETVILVDAYARGEAPGTLYTIEPDLSQVDVSGERPDAHSMDPATVLRLAKQLGVRPGRVLLVGCEPESFGPENEGRIGLSDAVNAAVNRAVALVESTIESLSKKMTEERGAFAT